MEREDWEAPEVNRPARLSERAARVVHAELKRGVSEGALAVYFDTSVQVIRQADKYIKRCNSIPRYTRNPNQSKTGGKVNGK